MKSKKFPDTPLNTISHDGIANLSADRDPEAGSTEAGPIEGNDYKMRAVLITPAGLYHDKLAPLADAQVLAKAAVRLVVRCRTGSLATLAASRLRGSIHGCQRRAGLGGTCTVSLFRPFWRRRFSTCWPPGVAIRARNP